MRRPPSTSRFADARWIWPAVLGRPVNRYVEFEQRFVLSGAPDARAELMIAADTVYAVWVNGVFIHAGRFPDVPPERQFDRLRVGRVLRHGRNTLRIGLHVQGADSFQHRPGDPGLIFAIAGRGIAVASGLRTVWRPSAGYRSGEMPRITGQLGFSFAFDANRAEDPWRRIGRADLAARAGALPLRPRPIRRSQVLPPPGATVAAQGLLTAGGGVPDDPSAAMQQDGMAARTLAGLFGPGAAPALPSAAGLTLLPAHLGGGFYVIVDLGREETGYVVLDLETDAGAVVDLGHGEHLDDLRVRAQVGGRNFASRLVCRDGRQTFVHWYKRMAGRYLQLNVRGARRRFTLYHASLHPCRYPVAERGSFAAADRRLDDIFAVSARTLRLCMHEHYEDCPWREQALYANDGRNQALAGYYAFGEGAFPAASLELLGRGLGPDGWIELCMPATIDITIPSFTFSWILAAGDHWLHRGDRRFVARVLPVVRRILDRRASELAGGLLPCPTGPRYWQFYDWAPGLSGEGRLAAGEARFDALLNLLLVLALRAGARLAQAAGAAAEARRWQALAAGLGPAIHRCFWNREAAAYVSYAGDRAVAHVAELVQAQALLTGIVPGAPQARALRARLRAPSAWVATTLSQSLYKYEALLDGAPGDQRAATEAIAAEWNAMLRRGATSFWETRRGAADFDGAGSLCHGWSAIPAYLFGAHVLGVRPVEPGFAVFRVAPAASGVEAASGRVATPRGPIEVAWRRTGRGYEGQVRHPAGCACVPSPGFQARPEPADRRRSGKRQS